MSSNEEEKDKEDLSVETYLDEEEQYSEVSKDDLDFKRIVIIGIIITTLIVVVTFITWVTTPYLPKEAAKKALISDSMVEVKNGEYISFTPKEKTPTKGFILYPGAKVEAESYAPLCREIAKEGFEVVIVKMPLNLSILSPNKAKEVLDDYNNIETWVIGGHSLGGVKAAEFASKHDDIKGVVLYSAYPQGDKLLKSNKKVVSMWGSNDTVLNMENINKSSDDLPKDTEFIEIEGANHAQFGDYGFQEGDSKASISRQEQTSIAAQNTIELLKNIK